VASLTGWLAFDRVADSQTQVNEQSIPQLAGSFAVAQRGSALSVAASRLTGVETQEELEDVVAGIRNQRQLFETQLLQLTSQSGERFGQVRNRGGAVLANIDAIVRAATERLALEERGSALRQEIAALRQELDAMANDAPGQTGSQAMLAINLLSSAMVALDAESLEAIRESFDDLAASIRRDASRAAVGARRRNVLTSAINRLSALGNVRWGAFGFRAEQLAVIEREQALFAENRVLADELIAAIDTVVSGAREGATAATLASGDAIDNGRLLLLTINGISILGAALAAWLVVGRLLLRRLERLSRRMRSMADGELEAEVVVEGRDEVAEMAGALEVFRRHALEVQRLNLVEKLARELREKNSDLETAMTQLRRAQDQIVAREKLAGLGELTAGVAHEIRNPLNFVRNFSEASEELLAELNEELADEENRFSDAQKEVVGEICDLLSTNLKRVSDHGGRADRIVSEMVRMGGSTGNRQPTDINRLLENQSDIAIREFQEANPEVQLEIERDMDPTAGRVDVVAQDIARVFQNLIDNACYAAQDRFRAEKERGKQYAATIRLATRQLDDKVEVRIRDNGTGIPQELVEKIFHPFFTTKPTDKGTGLGLSICNDIVRGHGGSIRVETESGRYTEMILGIPNATAAAAGGEASASAQPQ